MRRVKLISLGVAGVVLPVALVFSAYLIARGSIGGAGTVPPVPQTRVSDEAAPSRSPTRPAPTASPTRGGGADDHGGRCSEPEHLGDPSCSSDSSGSGSGSSGSGSGGGGGDDSPNSGPGGSGSGSDSGSGHSGDD